MLELKDTQVPGSVDVTFKFTDSKGRTAKVDMSGGGPTVTTDNAAVIDTISAVTDNGDGSFKATLHITDQVGAAQVNVDGDADLGDGVTDVKIVDVVNVIPGDATGGTLTFSAVTPDAPAPAPAPGP